MAYFYRRYRIIIYTVSAAVIGWALYAGISDIPEQRFWKVMPFVVLLMVFMVLFLTNRASARYRDTIKILNEDCDPLRFIEETKEPYKKSCGLKAVKTPSDLNKLAIILSNAVALDSAGKTDEAIEMIEWLLHVESKKRLMKNSRFKEIFDAQRAMQNVDLATMHTIRALPGDDEKARVFLENARQNAVAAPYIVRTEYIRDVLAGCNLESARDYFERTAEGGATTREKTVCMYYAALAAEKLGDIQSAAAMMEKAAQHSKLAIAQKASVWLKEHSDS